ncbi:MAG: aspartate aminotransferase family protein [Chloroflexota bacterium]
MTVGDTRFLHGFADMHAVRRNEVVLVRGEGSTITDRDGRTYIDATGGLWFADAGFGRAEIGVAAAEQMTRLHAYSSFGAYVIEPALTFADRISALAPMPDAKVFLGSGGSEGVETAGKLVRRYWDVMGRPEKQTIVAREFGYHGMAAYGTSLAGIAPNREGYGGALMESVGFVPSMDVDAVRALFEREGDRIGAFIGEPVIGAGGVYPAEAGYWPAIAELCRQHDVLLIADEVVTGFGRTGVFWGSDRYGFTPDILVFAKGATSGYQPLGGILVGPRVAEPFWERPGALFRHGYTYQGHGAACAAAMANLDILEREALVARVATLEPVLARILGALADAPLVKEIRTVGLTGAVELDAPPAVLEKVVVAARGHGVLTRVLRGKALHVSPPFVITEAEIGTIADGFRAALEEVAPTVG